MRNIFHYGGWCRNYGDMAIQYSMMHWLRHESKKQINFIPIDLKQPSPITEEMVDVMNRSGNMLIVGGGGLVMKGDGFKTKSGWQFNITQKALKKLKIPLVVYGIGVNIFPGEKNLSKTTWNHLKETRKRSILFSARDVASQRVLETHGVKNVEVIPDPAMMCPFIGVNLPRERHTSYIGINWAGDRREKRFYSIGEEIRFAEKICEGLKELTVNHPKIKFLYIPHVHEYDTDYHVVSIFKDILGDRFSNLADVLPWLYPEQLMNVPAFVGVYHQLDMAVGMRGHANIIPYGVGTPHVAIGNHRKNIYFASDNQGDVIQTNDSNITHTFRQVFENRLTLIDRYRSKNIQYAKVFNDFNKRLITLLERTDEI